MIFWKSLVVIGLLIGVYQYFESIFTGPTKKSFCFRAAVYEHVPLGELDVHKPSEILQMNLQMYTKAVQAAYAENVKLLVFPEDSLINSEQYNRSTLIHEVFEKIPNPQKEIVNLCRQFVLKNPHSILRAISCLASNYRMFIAVNFGDKVPCDIHTDPECPSDHYYLYNTLVLFDWNGDLVAKYHKMQLYYEFHYNLAKERTKDSKCLSEPIVYYESPFGRLGFVLCFDLLYKQPAVDLVYDLKVNTIIYSTYWFNYLPFVSSLQIQQGFAIRHQINFLAANVHIPKTGSLGSGVYSGELGALSHSHQADGQSKLLIATLPVNCKLSATRKKCPPMPRTVMVSQNIVEKLVNNHMNISQYKVIRLGVNTAKTRYCCPYSKICCRVSYQLHNESMSRPLEDFVLIIGNSTDGALGQARYPISQEFCGLAICEDSNCTKFTTTSETIFSNIYLSATMNSKFVYPSVVSSGYNLLPTTHWYYQQVPPRDNVVVVRNPFQPIAAVTLYGRLYDNDPEYEH